MKQIQRGVRAFAGLLAFLVLVAPAVHAQGLGIGAGLNFNGLSDIDTGDAEATFENAQSWHIALWFDLPLGPVAIRPGLRYMDAGALFDNVSEGGAELSDDVDVRLIEVPVDLRLRFNAPPIIVPYVLVGPVLRFPADTEEEGADRLESFSFAAEIGAGVELGLGGLRLYPELKYSFGITAFTKDEYEIGDTTFRPDSNQQLNALMLSLAVGF